ncbi:MAG: MarR family winged helix-turn-helix transcriptional regulator [Actinomycetota bacterium]
MSEIAGQDSPATSGDWASVRRVHFYVSDLIARDIEAFGIGVPERRMFEALHFGEWVSHQDGVSVAAICEMIPERPAAQTVASILDRMHTQGWVERLATKSAGPHGGRLWSLSPGGREVRNEYKRIVEIVLQEVYSDATNEERAALLDNARVAMQQRHTLLAPVADPSAPSDTPTRNNWGALRATHFYINDELLSRAKRLGVEVVERRVLDYLAFADDRGASDGVRLPALSAMIPGAPRLQTVESVLERMMLWGWTEKMEDAPSGPKRQAVRWRLTPRGHEIRVGYNGFAEVTLRQVYTDGGSTDRMLSLAAKAEQHRVLRILPIVEAERRASARTGAGDGADEGGAGEADG